MQSFQLAGKYGCIYSDILALLVKLLLVGGGGTRVWLPCNIFFCYRIHRFWAALIAEKDVLTSQTYNV